MEFTTFAALAAAAPTVPKPRMATRSGSRLGDGATPGAAWIFDASATGAEAGIVTAGAAAGLLLGTAACVAGLDPGRMARLPDTTGMKNEVVMVRSQRNFYDHAVRATSCTRRTPGARPSASAPPAPEPPVIATLNGVRKYSEMPCRSPLVVEPRSHMSRKKAIIAVTKSA